MSYDKMTTPNEDEYRLSPQEALAFEQGVPHETYVRRMRRARELTRQDEFLAGFPCRDCEKPANKCTCVDPGDDHDHACDSIREEGW